ncbi:MAG: A24 family peptidase [Armatimonadetes bacterium]|nr:A24 family peptidase [Armatimonadota bacterium]
MSAKVIEMLPVAILLLMLGAAVYTDIRLGKIYNKLTLPCMALGILLGAMSNGWMGFLSSIGGILIILIPFLLFAPAAGIGGGDIKLMMAVGSLLGFKAAIWAVLISAVVGGVLAIITVLMHRKLLSTTKNIAKSVFLSGVLKAPAVLTRGSKCLKVRYSPAIAIGTILTIIYQFGR